MKRKNIIFLNLIIGIIILFVSHTQIAKADVTQSDTSSYNGQVSNVMYTPGIKLTGTLTKIQFKSSYKYSSQTIWFGKSTTPYSNLTFDMANFLDRDYTDTATWIGGNTYEISGLNIDFNNEYLILDFYQDYQFYGTATSSKVYQNSKWGSTGSPNNSDTITIGDLAFTLYGVSVEKQSLELENITEGYSTTITDDLTINATSTFSEAGDYEITGEIFYSGTTYSSSTLSSAKILGTNGSFSTGDFDFQFIWNNLNPGYYNKLIFNMYKYENGIKTLVKQYIYNVNIQKTEESSEFTPDTTNDIEILTATTSDIGITSTIHWKLGDDAGFYISSLEIWNASSTIMYYQETRSGLNENSHDDYLTRDFSLENGDYYVYATLSYTEKLNWYEKLLNLGGDKTEISVKSNNITVNITSNTTQNPAPVYDKNNNINNVLEIDAINPILKAWSNAKEYLKPINYFPFSWIDKFYTDIKENQTYYDNYSDTDLDTTLAMNIGGSTTTITLLSQTNITNVIGTDNYNTIEDLMKTFLWIFFGFYIFKRTSSLFKIHK